MNKDNNIKKIFEQLRKEEEAQAPSFREILQGREPEKESPHPWCGILARPAVVMLILAAIAVPVLYNSLQGPSPTEISTEFKNWESPTGFLLEFSDDPLMSEIPEIETSLWEFQEDEYQEN